MAAVWLLLAGLGLPAPAAAADLMLRGLTEAQLLYRTATFSLRQGRPQEAQASLKALAALWGETMVASAADPPAPARHIALYAELVEGSRLRIERAGEALRHGRAETALEELAPLKREWIAIRRATGLYGLVECLDEADEALDGLLRLKRQPPDMNSTDARTEVAARTAVYRFALRRCDGFAAHDPAGNGEFRRQADAIAATLDVVDSALRLRDAALLERVLADLRAFNAQLSQRFGG